MTNVLRWATTEATLRDALNRAELPDDAVVLLSDPEHYRIGVTQNGVVVGPTGDELSLDTVFDARAFDGQVELRWRQTDVAGGGHAVLLAESPDRLTTFGTVADEALEPLGQVRYLAWGKATGGVSGAWRELRSGRIGRYCLPCAEVARDQRVRLVGVEYVRSDEHGNVDVYDERLTHLEHLEVEPHGE